MRLFYEDFGEGEPVVLIHGWPLSHRFWEAQTGPFVAAGKRVIAYDRRGFGRSSQPWDGYDPPTLLADLGVLVDTLGLDRVSLVGFSTGAAEAVGYAVSAPARVRRLVLASPVLFPDPLAADLHAAVRHRLPMLDDVLLRMFAVDGDQALDEQTRRYLLRHASEASPKGTADALLAWRDADPEPDLKRLDAPTLVVTGEADAFVPAEEQRVPGATLLTIADAPHGAPLTHGEQWNEQVLAFLA
ncbi:alpha/beta fold hydrolase [Herbidospora daliensis]|uniref:alpha/beta fold hydrolase n=1 Tax=Herbidospora daliensis TaxID=295585 RepID=UPI0018DB734E|nr:alpha/beta hydrolase [Herbidospora daliensis]